VCCSTIAFAIILKKQTRYLNKEQYTFVAYADGPASRLSELDVAYAGFIFYRQVAVCIPCGCCQGAV
jgi:hypothetical protein